MENTENVEKARAFMEYVAANLKRLKKNLRKNITYEEELFDDAISEAIVRCYDSIVKNGTDVKDYEQYFFIASKWVYVQRQNQRKRRQALTITDKFPDFGGLDGEAAAREEAHVRAAEVLNKLKSIIRRGLGREHADVYMEYMKGKLERGGTSFAKVAERRGADPKHIANIIRNTRRYLENDPRVAHLKTYLYADDI